MKGNVPVSRQELAEVCKRWNVKRMSLFGSVLREDFSPDSDVDILVEFEQGHHPGLDIVDMREELSSLFGGRKVDIINPRYLNHRLKDRILASAEVQYAKG